MSNSCEIIPKIKVKGLKKESKLFKDLLLLTNNRDTTKIIWGMSSSPYIKNLLGDIKVDENGEPTLKSIYDKFGLKNILNNNSELFIEKQNIGAIDLNGNTIFYNKYDEIINKVIDFNKENLDKVADIVKSNKGYSITVKPKTLENADIPNRLIFKNNLNNQLLSIMRKLGFDVKIDENLPYDGMFDPIHAETTADGLRTVIRIARGEIGEQAFPEEFSHLMISGLLQHPLVSRLLNLINNEDVIREILGDNYNGYYAKYNGDMYTLALEAAAKLLLNHIVNPLKEDSNIISRLWNFIKGLFRKLTESDVDNIIRRANDGFARLSTQITDESILSDFDGIKAMDASILYKLSSSIDSMKNLSEEALKVASKRLTITMSKSKRGRYSPEDMLIIKNLKDLIEKKKYTGSCLAFLTDTLSQIEHILRSLNKLLEKDARADDDLSKIRRISSLLISIKEFSEGYEPIIRLMMTLESMRLNGLIDITEEDAQAISKKASEVFDIINTITHNYEELRFNTVYNFLKIYWGEDKIIEIGKDKGKAFTLEQILKLANRDINGIDRWVSSMSDASDPLLSLIDKAVKVSKTKRDLTLLDITAELKAVHQRLVLSGLSNTEFMFERDSKGNITGRLISDYDFKKFNEEREKFRHELIAAKKKPAKVKAELEAWERKHLKEIVVDEETDRKELVPIYRKDVLSKLTPALREYYNVMIKAKAQLESLIPERYANLYNAVLIRNDTISALSNSSSPKDAAKLIIGNIKDKFVRRTDDTYDFGEDKSTILLDFSGKPLNRLPVYYTTPLKDLDRLSLDFTSSIMAYSAMAVNYNELSKVIDVLELTRDLVKDREVLQYSGDKKLAETYSILRSKFNKKYTKPGELSNIGGRIDDYYDVALYSRVKKDLGTIGSTNIDTAKALDAVKSYTGIVGLGLNIFSAISNVTVGKMQMFIEAMGGEYFNYKNLAVGKKNYYGLLPAYLAELNSTKKTSKLALLIDKFDALEEYYNSLRDQGNFLGPMSRIIGSSSLLFMQNMGEHYLHSRTMLAILDNYKVKIKDKLGKEKTISLFDAYLIDEIKDDNGNILSAKLTLKDGVTKLDGSNITVDDIVSLKLLIGKINQALNGAFNTDDKGAIHRGALGRLAMLFRQWMPAHYNRRFARPYYDAALDLYREGYYFTLGKFSLDLIKDLSRAKFLLATHWNLLNNHQKVNMKRAFAEIGIFAILTCLISMIGPEKDKKGAWFDRKIIYHLKRMKLETGASMPFTPDFLKNIWTLILSPAAAVKTLNNITDLIQFQNMFIELESGRYKGWSIWERDFTEVLPIYGQVRKAFDIKDEDYMFNIYK